MVPLLWLLGGCDHHRIQKAGAEIPKQVELPNSVEAHKAKDSFTLASLIESMERPIGELQITIVAAPEARIGSRENLKEVGFPQVEGKPVTLYIKSESTLDRIIAQHRELKYTMWLTKWGLERSPDVFFWQPEIATVDDQGKVVYDASVCPCTTGRCHVGNLKYIMGHRSLNSWMRSMLSFPVDQDSSGVDACPDARE